jgi:hypothetical protein
MIDFNEAINNCPSEFFLESWRDAIETADSESVIDLVINYGMSPDTPVDQNGNSPIIWILENHIEGLAYKQALLLVNLIDLGADYTSPTSPGLFPVELALISKNKKASASLIGLSLLDEINRAELKKNDLVTIASLNPIKRIFSIIHDTKQRSENLRLMKRNHEYVRSGFQEDQIQSLKNIKADFWITSIQELKEENLPLPDFEVKKLKIEFAHRAARAMQAFTNDDEYENWEERYLAKIETKQWKALQASRP